MGEGKLTIFNPYGQLFAEVHRSSGRLYLLKLNIVDQCLIMSEDTAEEWLLITCNLNMIKHDY